MPYIKSDQWETPQRLFEELNEEFNFDMDLCSTNENSKCNARAIDYFILGSIIFKGGEQLIGPIYQKEQNRRCDLHLTDGSAATCFMNPPYSNPYPFIKKAWDDSRHFKIVMLLKVDTSTKWWGIFWNYKKHRPKKGVEVRFLPKRLKFELNGEPGTTAPFPSCIVILDRRTS